MVARSDSSSQYWMGAVRDPQDPNNWKWVNGNDVTVSFWNAPGGAEGCARFDGSKGWLWADTDCQSRLNYICQHRKFILHFCKANLLQCDLAMLYSLLLRLFLMYQNLCRQTQ